jgi:hypothetical protein
MDSEGRRLVCVDWARFGSMKSFNLSGDEWDETRDHEAGVSRKHSSATTSEAR